MNWISNHLYLAMWIALVVVIVRVIKRKAPEGKSINRERAGMEILASVGWVVGFTPIFPIGVQAIASLFAIVGMIFYPNMEEYV